MRETEGERENKLGFASNVTEDPWIIQICC